MADELERHLQQIVGERPLGPERVAELRLTLACARGDPPALEAFDALLREEVSRVVRPLDPSAVDDVTQLVRERLLLPGEGGRPRVEGYRGDAPLRAWLRAVALRTALNERRAGGREEAVPEVPELEASAADPELALLRARYRDTFRGAFASAVRGLEARERTVLRLHTLDGVTLARIGAIYQKDTSTVSRWLEQTRRKLLAATRTQLAETLRLESGELDSLMRAAESEMSVSLHQLLHSSTE